MANNLYLPNGALNDLNAWILVEYRFSKAIVYIM
jgi:hypothetical protein